MMQSVELFYDFRSPYSYLAATQLLKMEIGVAFRPMKILTVMERVGNVPTTLTCAAKGRYARMDLARWAGRYGVVLDPSDMRANDGDALSRAVIAAAPADRAAVTLALYRAIWSEKKTIGDAAAAVAALDNENIDTGAIKARIDAAETIAQLDANTDEAVARGVFGSPTIFVGDTMFFGNDRLDFVREALAFEEAA
jgi:2-hydroxychromene-2-carboxylate isomerase